MRHIQFRAVPFLALCVRFFALYVPFSSLYVPFFRDSTPRPQDLPTPLNRLKSRGWNYAFQCIWVHLKNWPYEPAKKQNCECFTPHEPWAVQFLRLVCISERSTIAVLCTCCDDCSHIAITGLVYCLLENMYSQKKVDCKYMSTSCFTWRSKRLQSALCYLWL